MLKSKKLAAVLCAASLSSNLVNSAISVWADELATINQPTLKKIDVLTFNDFHGNVLKDGKNIGAARLAGVINEYQLADELDDTYGVVTVSAGDLYQGTAISNLTQGAPVTEMLKEINLAASAIGNHEFDWGADKIAGWANDGGFEFVAANIVYEGTDTIVDFAEPYIITESEGVNIAFIGIAGEDTVTSTKAENVEGLDFLDAVETLDKWTPIARAEGADIVIALTHSAATENSDGTITGEAAEIAENAENIDAVIAAHNHKFVDGIVNGIPVVQAGYNGRGLSVISFTLDENNNIVQSEGNTRNLYEEGELPVNKVVEEKVNEINENLKPILAEKVTDLPFDLEHDRNNGLTPLGVTVAEAMKEIGQTDVAIANGGGIRAPLSAGDLTVGDMYTILPFDNQLVTLKVTGADLKLLIEHGINPPSFGWGQFAGLKVWYDPATDKITSMRLEDGTKVEDDQYYTVTTIDFLLTGGDSYDFSNAIDVVDTCEVMREGIQAYWKENGIKAYDYNLLIAGEDTTVDEPSKDEVVGGDTAAGDKEENKDEVKDEIVSDDKIVVGGTETGKTENDKNTSKLPNTGAPISSVQVVLAAMIVMAIGAGMLRNEKSKVE